jgi:hypothetical protein
VMEFLRRLVRARSAQRAVRVWQDAWVKVAENPDRQAVGELRARFDRLSARDGDLEIEREMLEAVEHMVEFAATIAREGLPVIATGHRVVGRDLCHFTAPVSMPDDPAQPSGRLLLTNSRAIFVGGARGMTVAWHAVTKPKHSHRDLILVRVDGTSLYRFRFNSFDDAMSAAFIARQLAGSRKAGS